MRKILTSIILLIFTTCAASATEPADTAKTPQPSEAYLGFMEQADKAIAENKWADAELALKEALRLEPAFSRLNLRISQSASSSSMTSILSFILYFMLLPGRRSGFFLWLTVRKDTKRGKITRVKIC